MFRLCLQLGWPHPDFLGEVLSVEQVYEWMDFASREPWGFEVDDHRAALQALVVARSAGSKSAKLEHFRLQTAARRQEEHGPESTESLRSRLKAAFRMPQRKE